MSEMSRRHLLKSSLATAVAATGIAGAGTANAATKTDRKIYDVVVLGCGCAGMAAAIEAKRAGYKVCILDKMSRPAGNTIYAGGIINAAGTYVQKRDGVTDDLKSFYEDMMKVSRYRGDKELTQMYVDKSAEAIQWLTDVCGIKYRKLENEVWPMLQRGHVVEGPLKPAGAQLSKQMLDTCKKLRVDLFFNTKAIELTHDEVLRCTGVKAIEKGEKAVEFVAKGGVVVATGGFHANKEMVVRYMGGGVDWMPLRGSTVITGENISLTMPFNPMCVNMDQFHGGPIHGPTRANPSIMVNYGILVKKDATRFIDEVETYVYVAKEMPKLIPSNQAFIIIDDQVTGISTIDDRIKRYEKANAKYYKANSIKELAEQAGLPVDTLVKVVDEYNAAVKAGKANQLTPPNTLNEPRLLEKAPFYAFPFMGGMTATFGGPKINKDAEVLNTEGNPIPGLYAAGNAIGGLLYHDYIGGSQLCAAVIWGRVAGLKAGERSKKVKS